MKKICLTQGLSAIVDDEDCELLSRYNWVIHKSGSRRCIYAKGNIGGRNELMHRFILENNGIDVQGKLIEDFKGESDV